jgi:hypothetical protein
MHCPATTGAGYIVTSHASATANQGYAIAAIRFGGFKGT